MLIRTLTEKEERVMCVLWRLKNAYVQDIVEEMEEPRPHYNTTSSIVRKLEKEGFIGHLLKGRSHKYFPILKKKAYRSLLFDHLLEHYFNDSEAKFILYSKEKLNLSKSKLRKIIS